MKFSELFESIQENKDINYWILKAIEEIIGNNEPTSNQVNELNEFITQLTKYYKFKLKQKIDWYDQMDIGI